MLLPRLRSIVALFLIATSALPISALAEKHKDKSGKTRVQKKAPLGPSYAKRQDVQQAAREIAQQHQLDLDWVRHRLAQAHYIPAIAKAVLPPAVGVAKNWQAYRSRFVEPQRIRAGLAFWQTHAAALQRAQEQSGVPMEIIVGIIGVETLYGQHMGGYRVLDALATLAFDFPASHPRAARRAEYFLGELGHFLALMQARQTDPSTLLGSYAGAIGLPQFMPSSWARYAIDFDSDGRIDLLGSPVDAIGSVANFLQAHGWQAGMPTHYPVQFDTATLDLPTLLAPDIVPTFELGTFQAKGAVLQDAALQHVGKLALVELHNGDAAPSYIAGTDNFYALTRYNWSSYYALAVIELGAAIRQAASTR